MDTGGLIILSVCELTMAERMTIVTTKERLSLMDEIKRTNDAAWRKYATQTAPGWTWAQPVKQRFRPFDSACEQCLLACCVSLLLVLFILMA